MNGLGALPPLVMHVLDGMPDAEVANLAGSSLLKDMFLDIHMPSTDNADGKRFMLDHMIEQRLSRPSARAPLASDVWRHYERSSSLLTAGRMHPNSWPRLSRGRVCRCG